MLKRLVIITLLFSTSLLAETHLNESTPITNLKHYREQLSFQLIGETTFSILFWDLYKSKLLTTTGKYPVDNKQETLIYEIHYLADISKNDLIKRTIEQWQHIGVPEKSFKGFIPQLEKIWPNITKGDTLSLLIYSKGSAFYFNQQYIGAIEAPEFGNTFLDIWLSKKTSQPKLRSELLEGQKHD